MKIIQKKIFECYADGACNKKGEGSAGLVLLHEENIISIAKISNNDTTNNKMELTAAMMSILLFKNLINNSEDKFKGELNLYTDSHYVQKGLTQWIYNWKRNKWKSTSGDVKNKEYWVELDKLKNELTKNGHSINIIWVRGHNGNAGNEAADRIAALPISESINIANQHFPENNIIDSENLLIESYENILDILDFFDEL